MKKSYFFLIFIICLIVQAFTGYSSPVRVAASAYPILVEADDQKTASELIFFSDSFLSYLRDKWDIVPIDLPALKIIASHKTGLSAQTDPMTSSRTFAIDPESDDCLRNLSVYLCNQFIRNIFHKRLNYNSELIIPRVIPEGIVGAYFQIKIDSQFAPIHRMLADGNTIPLEVMLKVDRRLSSSTMEQLFVLQATYFMEYLITTNNGRNLFKQFLLQAQSDSQMALLYVARSHGKKNTTELAIDFYESTILNRPAYNVVSPYKYFSAKSLQMLLEEILVFRYSYTMSNGVEKQVTVKAGDVKVGDTPYITAQQIEQSVFQLRLLKSCTAEHNHRIITAYIKALEYLKDNDFNNFLDQYYLASYNIATTQKETTLTP